MSQREPWMKSKLETEKKWRQGKDSGKWLVITEIQFTFFISLHYTNSLNSSFIFAKLQTTFRSNYSPKPTRPTPAAIHIFSTLRNIMESIELMLILFNGLNAKKYYYWVKNRPLRGTLCKIIPILHFCIQ